MAHSSQPRPWSGSLSLNFFPNVQQAVYVTAADVDLHARPELWPGPSSAMPFYAAQTRIAPAEIAPWLRDHATPICVFMPNKHPDSAVNSANRDVFARLVQYLRQNSLVAYSTWTPSDTFPNGGGIVLYPSTSTTDSLILAAVFVNSPLPDFIIPQAGSQTQYQSVSASQSSAAYYQYPGQFSSQ